MRPWRIVRKSGSGFPHDALIGEWSIGSISKVRSTFEADALEERTNDGGREG
jgi:hypothetical protein